MGKIEEISVKGIDVEMVVAGKYDLILITLMDKDFYKDIIREHSERILDLFHKMHSNDLEGVVDVSKFEPFKQVIMSEIQVCLEKMKELESKRQILKAGFEYND